MKKPEGLKRMLIEAVPQLRRAPESLSMFIDKGRIAARATGSLSFEHRYTLNIVVQDFGGDVDMLFVPLLAWIAEQQPDLLDRGEQEPFSFESELLDDDCSDLSIFVELTERVRVERTPEGLKVTHLDDRRPEDSFPGVCGVPLWQGLFDDGAEVIESNAVGSSGA